MKIALKMLIAAILSLTVGIACASPLLVTELNIRPWVKYVQGTTAQFDVSVVYTNFTLQNADKPITQDSGPTISYYAVVNITNLSDLNAQLSGLNFIAAQKFTNNSEAALNMTSAIATSAEGAWVDGKWYNLTWVNVTYPYFDENGNFHQPVFKLPGEPYWMEGVQVYDRYVNGTLTATYLNMNGTWTDVTGRVTMAHPTLSMGESITGIVADDRQAFVNLIDSSDNGTMPVIGGINMTTHLAGIAGQFKNTLLPHESRFLAVSGSWEVHKSYAKPNAVESLQSANLTFKAQTSNIVEEGTSFVNNTLTTTWSDAVEYKQVFLTQMGNGYVYNPLSLDAKAFRTDQWGIEVFVNPGSQVP